MERQRTEEEEREYRRYLHRLKQIHTRTTKNTGWQTIRKMGSYHPVCSVSLQNVEPDGAPAS